MFNFDLGKSITQGIAGIWRSIVFGVDKNIYKLVAFLYDMFETLCKGKLLTSSDINDLFKRIALILSLVMIISVAFTYIKVLLDPDKAYDMQKGIPGAIKKVILVIIMLGTSTYVFALLSNVQTAILSNDAIPKLLLPKTINKEYVDSAGQTKQISFGSRFSGELFLAFWQRRDKDGTKAYGEAGLCDKEYMDNAEIAIKVESNFELAEQCLNVTGEIDDSSSTVSGNVEAKTGFVIDFNWFIATIVGLIAAWLLLSYCLNVGIRMIQLTLLQILSPVAIIGYLSPKESTSFEKWVRIYFSTYIDVFIRLVILNFVAYLMALIFESEGEFWTSIGMNSGADPIARGFVTVIICLSLLAFAKKAPELIGKIWNTGDSGLNFGTEGKGAFAPALAAGSILAGGMLGGISGGIVSGISRARDYNEINGKGGFLAGVGGFASGLGHGVLSGAKKGNVISNVKNGLSSQNARNDNYRSLIASGGSIPGRMMASVFDKFGGSRGTVDTRRMNNTKEVREQLAAGYKKAEETVGYRQFMQEVETAYRNGDNEEAQRIQKLADEYKDWYYQQSVRGQLDNYKEYTYKDIEKRAILDKDGKYVTDVNGEIQYEDVEVTKTKTISSGDKSNGNEIRAGYINAKAATDSIKIEHVDADGNPTGEYVKLKDPASVTAAEVNDTIKQLHRDEHNITARKGYRQGQANKTPNNK